MWSMLMHNRWRFTDVIAWIPESVAAVESVEAEFLYPRRGTSEKANHEPGAACGMSDDDHHGAVAGAYAGHLRHADGSARRGWGRARVHVGGEADGPASARGVLGRQGRAGSRSTSAARVGAARARDDAVFAPRLVHDHR